jgi:hypothetical protein
VKRNYRPPAPEAPTDALALAERSIAVITAPSRDVTDDEAIEPLLITLEEARLAGNGVLHIRGWCVGLQPLRSVELKLGDISLGRAEIGLPRKDVAEKLPDYPNAPRAGFAMRRMLARGQADGELIAVATDCSGLTRTDSLVITAEPGAAPALLLTLEEARLDGTGTLHVRGWAVSTTPLRQVDIHLDDRFVGTAETLVSRPDVGLAYPDYPGSALVGFCCTRNSQASRRQVGWCAPWRARPAGRRARRRYRCLLPPHLSSPLRRYLPFASFATGPRCPRTGCCT